MTGKYNIIETFRFHKLNGKYSALGCMSLKKKNVNWQETHGTYKYHKNVVDQENDLSYEKSRVLFEGKRLGTLHKLSLMYL